MDVWRNVEQLPDLSALESDLEYAPLSRISDGLDTCIENRNPLRLDRMNEVFAVIELLLALSAVHHWRERPRASDIPNICMVVNDEN